MRFPRALLLAAAAAWGGETPRSLVAAPGSTPLIDGQMSFGEWRDAAQIRGPGNWTAQFSPAAGGADLSFTVSCKHDGRRLYFAFDVSDNLLYGIDVPRWLPPQNPKANELTPAGWPWFGDAVELLIHAGPPPKAGETAAGNGFSWQMVANLTKSRLGGSGAGGLLEGEPRNNPKAWQTYRQWIESKAMEAVVKPKPSGRGYIVEWAINFNPCLEVEPGRYYSVEMGRREMGLNIAILDVDRLEEGHGNFGNIRHEMWFAGPKDLRTQLRYWGKLWMIPPPAASRPSPPTKRSQK